MAPVSSSMLMAPGSSCAPAAVAALMSCCTAFAKPSDATLVLSAVSSLLPTSVTKNFPTLDRARTLRHEARMRRPSLVFWAAKAEAKASLKPSIA
eukprot:14363341-Alexandrium_andersonii.AAC.1